MTKHIPDALAPSIGFWYRIWQQQLEQTFRFWGYWAQYLPHEDAAKLSAEAEALKPVVRTERARPAPVAATPAPARPAEAKAAPAKPAAATPAEKVAAKPAAKPAPKPAAKRTARAKPAAKPKAAAKAEPAVVATAPALKTTPSKKAPRTPVTARTRAGTEAPAKPVVH